MTPKQPPRVATWILKHFGCGQDLDVVLGDLAEQYQQKASAMWYWRQVIQTIPVALFREVRAHKRMSGRALLTGWGLWFFCLLWFFPFASTYFFPPRIVPKPPRVFSPFESPNFYVGGGMAASFSFDDPIGSASSVLWMPVGAPLAGSYRDVSKIGFGFVLPLIVAGICGWLVARFHRDLKRAAVLLFAGSMLLVYLLLFGRFALLVGGLAGMLAGPLAVYVVLSTAGVLLGGGLLAEPAKAT
jgi:hypothetical protein